MNLRFVRDYMSLTDEEVVRMIVTEPYDDEAAAFILYDRYEPLLRKIYNKVYDDIPYFYEDCQTDLFCYLKEGNPYWKKLRSFQWRCKFSTWIKVAANNRFVEIKPQLIGKIKNVITTDDEDNPVEIQDEGVEDYERAELKVALMEAISQMEDRDQKFVVLKKLEGYTSKEIADLMIQSWKKNGIIKYDKGKRVIPSVSYVDVRYERAKVNLRTLILQML